MAKAARKPKAKKVKPAKKNKARAKTKKCQGKVCGGKRHPIDNFPNSPHTKDGKLNYCRECWSGIMKKARAKRKSREDAGEVPKRRGGRPRKKDVIQTANDAIQAANGKKERFLVIGTDGDHSKEFKNEQKALRCAMDWKLSGVDVRMWREVEVEMVLRIIG